MGKRVVITSVGVISSLGFSLDQINENIVNSSPTFMKSDCDNEIVTSPVKNFSLKQFTGRWKNARYLTKGAQFALASAILAFKGSDLTSHDIENSGLFIGSGPNLDITGEFSEDRIDWKKTSALWILKFLPNTASSAISDFLQIHGENSCIGTACSASLQAIGEAFRKIKDGYLDIAFAGGGDSRLTKGGIMAYKKAHALYMGQDDPYSASKPFDDKRAGFVQGEGGAFFILEELDHAKKRGANIVAEIIGFSSSMDGHNMTAPQPEGKWAQKAVKNAIKESKLSSEAIDAISAHATSTQLNDQMEANMLERVFADSNPYVFAAKSWIGHLSAACGAVELAVTLSCLKNNIFPEIRNLNDPCNKNINYLRDNKEADLSTVLLENFGFGGQNSSLIVRKWI